MQSVLERKQTVCNLRTSCTSSEIRKLNVSKTLVIQTETPDFKKCVSFLTLIELNPNGFAIDSKALDFDPKVHAASLGSYKAFGECGVYLLTNFWVSICMPTLSTGK